MRDAMSGRLDELRYEPTEKRVRALLAGEEVVDSTRALLVWEPKRVVPSYAVAVEDVRGELVPAAAAGAAERGSPRSCTRASPSPSTPRRARPSTCAPARRCAKAWPSRRPTPTWRAT